MKQTSMACWRGYLTALCLCLQALAGQHALAAPETATGKAQKKIALVIGVIAPSLSADETRGAWEPFAAKLGRRLNRPVTVTASKDYNAIIKGLIDGQIQVAWLSNIAALEAVESGKADIFAQMLVAGADRKPSKGYNSVVVVRQESGIKTFEDLLQRGSTIHFRIGDRKSTSGFLVPNYYLFAKRSLNADKVFKSVVQGSHEENLLALLEGRADAAVNNSEELSKLAVRDAAAAKRVRVIWKSPEIKQSPLLWRKDLAAEDKALILDQVLAYGQNDRAETRQLQAMNNIVGFARSSNRQLIPISDIEMFAARTANMLRTDLSAPDRAKVERAVIERASRLELLLHDE